jgi:hypothetical protein
MKIIDNYFKKKGEERKRKREEFDKDNPHCKYCNSAYLVDLMNMWNRLGFCCECHYHKYVLEAIDGQRRIQKTI